MYHRAFWLKISSFIWFFFQGIEWVITKPNENYNGPRARIWWNGCEKLLSKSTIELHWIDQERSENLGEQVRCRNTCRLHRIEPDIVRSSCNVRHSKRLESDIAFFSYIHFHWPLEIHERRRSISCRSQARLLHCTRCKRDCKMFDGNLFVTNVVLLIAISEWV